jgi:hypothetical protein
MLMLSPADTLGSPPRSRCRRRTAAEGPSPFCRAAGLSLAALARLLSRRERPLDRQPARHLPAGLLRQPHQPPRCDRRLVVAASGGSRADAARRRQGLLVARHRAALARAGGLRRDPHRSHRHQGAPKPGRSHAAGGGHHEVADRVPRGQPQRHRRGRRVQERALLPRQEAARHRARPGAHRQPQPRAAARRVSPRAAALLHQLRPSRSGSSAARPSSTSWSGRAAPCSRLKE